MVKVMVMVIIMVMVMVGIMVMVMVIVMARVIRFRVRFRVSLEFIFSFLVVCGDGEYIIHTALSFRNKSFGQAVDFVWSADSSEFVSVINWSFFRVLLLL